MEYLPGKNKEDLISSRQITEATGKTHTNVMDDIDRMCEQAGIVILEKLRIIDDQEVIVIKSEYEAGLGMGRTRKYPEYLLNEMAAELLATGYDVRRRLAVLRLVREVKKALEIRLPTKKELAQMVIDAENLIESQKERLQLQEKTIKESSKKVEYHDEVLQGGGLIATSVIAKDLGISAKRLNEFLYKQGVQYKCNGVWLLYSKYQNEGYTKSRTIPYTGQNGEIKTHIHTYWTEKGRRFIINFWNKVHGVTDTLKFQ